MAWTGAILLTLALGHVTGAHWTHSTDLDPNYSVFWTPGEEDITFEVQVRTLGYVGFGFSADGQMAGADMVTGWVRDNQVFFQDRHALERTEPEVDSSQDYELLLGYENGTHTVIRFRRRYDTCDPHDFRITNDTMRILYAYYNDDPAAHTGSKLGALPYHGPAQRGARRLYLIQRVSLEEPLPRDLHIWDLRNPVVTLPASEETLCWCKIFRLPYIRRKHHMVRYVPLREPVNRTHVHRVIVYECQGSEAEFEVHAKERGQVCYQSPMPPIFFNCNNVVIAWGIGSEGFTFPPEAGYPLDPDLGPKYFMMETHYNNSVHSADNTGTSGMRVYYTASLRRHDAGVLSVGMDPNWRHIIPPGQPEVVSEGHCISTCTWQAFPPRGIKVFAAALHMHLIGRRIRLRQIRNGVELPPIAADNNYDPGYQEYRRLLEPVQVYRGDHLIAQCVYNSEGRTTITLGGLTSREEMCLVFAMYYPRIDLSLCHSLPSLPTVLHSLGIQELWPDSSPVTIKSPPELADMTLESRLVTYDWENHFRSFQEATRKGSFKPLCWMKKPTLLPGTENLEAFYPNITKPFEAVNLCQKVRKKPGRRKKPEGGEEEGQGGGQTKVYNRITDQETSKLNRCNRITCSWLVSVIIWSAILIWS
ncbi:MOXD1 homolog 2 [Cryptotermes secundus]|uniref:MOXD1 homolog 2 n=1 Tax=Cryptotermes secundus TaxID=105785 RepID=UPI000CD7C400|nr:MOXD1 homolog 2 [Cryptotermes secundus]XP_033606241.1 MOXD1 homolog 2 [Cryptotermes secundus]